MVHELHDALEDPNGVVVIEWGGVVADVLPEQHLRVELKRTGDDTRKLNLSYPEALAYLVEGIC